MKLRNNDKFFKISGILRDRFIIDIACEIAKLKGEKGIICCGFYGPTISDPSRYVIIENGIYTSLEIENVLPNQIYEGPRISPQWVTKSIILF